MPPVTILSPYSGRSVVVREQDLGRAIRDEQGRVFYVVEDEEHGRYASMTRKGSAKDLEHYRELQAGGPAASDDVPGAAALSQAPAHDATGVQRRNPVGIVLLVLVGLLILGGGAVYLTQPQWLGLDKEQPTPEDNTPATPAAPAKPGDAQPTPDPNNPKPTSRRPTPPIRVAHVAPTHDRAASPLAQPAKQPTQADARSQPIEPAAQHTPAVTPRPVFITEPAAPTQGMARFEEDPVPVIVSMPREPSDDRPSYFVNSETSPYADFRLTASGLRYKITHHTDGPSAKAGHFVRVRYTAQTLTGKSLIDDAEQSFVLMSGEAIRAFDEGLAGIRQGEQLRLLVPRGHSAAGILPGIDRLPDEPFLLDVQVLAVRPGVSHIVEQPGQVDRDTARPGDTLQIHYVVRVEGRSEVIDSTEPRDDPLSFTLGQGEVIPGLDLGLSGMRLGETRLLTIPPYLAYGKHGAAGGLIPPDAVLSFRVTLLNIKPRDTDQ